MRLTLIQLQDLAYSMAQHGASMVQIRLTLDCHEMTALRAVEKVRAGQRGAAIGGGRDVLAAPVEVGR